MPIWIPLTVLVVAPIATYAISSYIELTVATASLVIVVEAGPAMVLATRALAAWTPRQNAYLLGWTDWVFLIGAPLVAVVSITWSQLHTAGENPAITRRLAVAVGATPTYTRTTPDDTSRYPTGTSVLHNSARRVSVATRFRPEQRDRSVPRKRLVRLGVLPWS
jgi:hypothetical protein